MNQSANKIRIKSSKHSRGRPRLYLSAAPVTERSSRLTTANPLNPFAERSGKRDTKNGPGDSSPSSSHRFGAADQDGMGAEMAAQGLATHVHPAAPHIVMHEEIEADHVEEAA